jgi:hypothetical protein
MVWVPPKRRRPQVRARFAELVSAFNTKFQNDPGPVPAEYPEPLPMREADPWTIHHIPPRHPKPYLLKRVRESHHRAYHLIFGSAGSLEECITILRAHWWPNVQ